MSKRCEPRGKKFPDIEPQSKDVVTREPEPSRGERKDKKNDLGNGKDRQFKNESMRGGSCHARNAKKKKKKGGELKEKKVREKETARQPGRIPPTRSSSRDGKSI